ncbi:MAG: amidohydrolase family protein, partial [Rhodospirillaceae bacterium]|nr:amidohydrolase family protein [Rhodospirillaceae bacterium]
MQGKIAFEEHMAIEETLGGSRHFAGESGRWDEFTRELLDIGEQRIEAMERCGVEFALLSLNAPAVQGILDTDEAIAVARKANDRIAEAAAKFPHRYAGLAALPMQDPDAASAELTRCVRDLGFKGAMVNGFTQKDEPDSAIYYDIP